jgi:hypothetical protein
MRPIAAVAVLFVAALLGCDSPKVISTEAVGCTKDTDCKGDRVCENARCIAPPAMPVPTAANVPAAATSPAPDTPTAPSLAKLRVNSEPDSAHVSEEGVELCSSTPCDILYKGADAEPTREHTLTFARRGYRSETRTLRAAESPLSVRLIRSL